MIKKYFILILSFSFLQSHICNAQINFLGTDLSSNDITEENIDIDIDTDTEPKNNQDDFFNDYIDEIETQYKAKNSARNILSKKPEKITLRSNQQKLIEKGIEKRKLLEEKIEQNKKIENEPKELLLKIQSKYQQAPLGLYWDATIEEIKTLGFNLKSAEREDYSEVYQVTNPKQNNNTFDIVSAIFGINNHLWCIYAQSYPLDDDSSANEALKLYKKYFKALSVKYGNAKEHYTPYTYTEEKIEGEGNNKKITQITKQNPIGGKNFLKELQEGKASLYASFENNEVGVILSISVDNTGKSFISIDYKNFKSMKNEQDASFNRLIEDI